ncbi:hypothetical protein FRX31_013425, partial [Thalictrum thalictroides]
MSSNTLTLNCSICHKSLPSSLFIRNQRTNTFYKTCSICREQRNVRRRILRRQRTDASTLPEVLINDGVSSIGNENNMNNIDPQIFGRVMDMETNIRITECTNLGTNTINPDMNIDLVYCNCCKRNCDSNLFTGRIRGKTYKSCSDCRLRDSNRRRPHENRAMINAATRLPLEINTGMKYCAKCKKHCSSESFASELNNSTFTTCIDCRTLDRTRRYPPIFSTTHTDLNIMHPLGIEEDIYDASDDENTNLDENLRVPGDEDVVGEEAIGNDEPIIFISHTDTREYDHHMRARDALPENHDDILNNVQELNNADDNIDPFENASQYLNDENYLTTANNHTNINANEEPITIINDNERRELEEDTTTIPPRRLPQWLAPLPTHRTIP